MGKEIKLIMVSALIFLIMGSVFAMYGNPNIQGKGYGKQQGGHVYQVYDDTQVSHSIEIVNYPVEDLSDEEIEGLMLMREEEKLARDVYTKLYEIWGMQIFSNIARSEQTHTNAVKSLIDKYGLEDPVLVDEVGEFDNDDLKDLYDELVEKGSVSLLDALIVGATVEDLDIKDLQELNEIADNHDISAVYDNLEKGSRNHLRAFVKQIERNGGTYEPVYISEDYYDMIIMSDMERNMGYGSNGQYANAGRQNSNSNMGANSGNNVNGNGNGGSNGDGNGGNSRGNGDTANGGSNVKNQEQNMNMFQKMWRGFLSWF